MYNSMNVHTHFSSLLCIVHAEWKMQQAVCLPARDSALTSISVKYIQISVTNFMSIIITIIIIIIIIQRRNSPLPGHGRLTVRFLDHAEGFLGRVISSPQGGQAITVRKFLIILDPPIRVLWQLDQQRHLVTKQGIGRETWPLNFAYMAYLHS
jgi:hypothetical protein